MEKKMYLVIKARTNSEWDSVDFALVSINKDYLDSLRKKCDQAAYINGQYPEFNTICFWGGADGYYIDLDDDNTPDDIATFMTDDTKDFIVCHLTEEQVSKLATPESRMSTEQEKVGIDSVQYTAYGKHNSDDEFWTSEVNIEGIIAAYQELIATA